MKAEKFLELKNIKPIYRLIDGKKTGEFIVTPELMEEYAQQQVKNLTIPTVSSSFCNCPTLKQELHYGYCVPVCFKCNKVVKLQCDARTCQFTRALKRVEMLE